MDSRLRGNDSENERTAVAFMVLCFPHYHHVIPAKAGIHVWTRLCGDEAGVCDVSQVQSRLRFFPRAEPDPPSHSRKIPQFNREYFPLDRPFSHPIIDFGPFFAFVYFPA